MSDPVTKTLRKAGADVGDLVRIEAEGFVGEGRLMPRHAFSAPDCIILKLDSGYNVGLRLTNTTRITRLKSSEEKPKRTTPPKATGKPPVAVLGTGGTIASYVDYRTGAVHPAATAEELAYATPELFDLVDVRAEVVFQVFSEDMTPERWVDLARRVAKAFKKGARGVVIPHGTDTLGYTGAALAFMLRDLPGPVVLVGAQRSSDRPSSDAASNLVAACRVAAEADLGEVVVVMHAGPGDDVLAIHRGVRTRKNHTSRRDAFQSVNAPPIGHVQADRIRFDGPHRARSATGPTLVDGWEPDVGLVWSHPGLDARAVKAHAGKGLVIAGTGLGHVPEGVVAVVQQLTEQGTLVAMTSQCLWGRVNLNIYSRGRDLLRAGVVDAGDMLPETAFVKMQHALGTSRSREDAARILRTDVAGELDERTRFLAGGGFDAG